MFSPISVGAYIYQKILGSPGAEEIDEDEQDEEDDLDFETPDVQDEEDIQSPRTPKREIVEEIPISFTSHQAEESAPPVGELLQALTHDDQRDGTYGGDVNENVLKQPSVQISDEVLASKSGEYATEADGDVNGYHGDVNNFSLDSDSEDSQEFDRIGDHTNPEEMERFYSSPEPEVPFTQSKIKSDESSNIYGLLKSLSEIPKPKPSETSNSPKEDDKGRRKVTDDEVSDALQFLLGRGARMPRTRSAMDLRDERAKKLRGDDKLGSRAFILVMMPDGTPRRVSVDRYRRGSLGNELDSSDEHLDQSLDEALRHMSPATRRKKPKNDFDGREERPPTPRTSSASSSDDEPKFINQEPSNDYSNQVTNSTPSDGCPEPPFPEPVSDQRDQESDSDDSQGAIVPSPQRPNEDIFDFSRLEKLRPDGEFDSQEEPVSKPKIFVPDNVTIDDLVANLPKFDTVESDNEDNDLESKRPLAVVEADIQMSAAVIPEESSIDLHILETEPRTAPPMGQRSPSSSDASSSSSPRSHSSSDSSSPRSHSSSDTSSTSIDSQVLVVSDEQEHEIVPVSKESTETSPDLSSLERLRPVGMEAPVLESNDRDAPTQQLDHLPTTERSDVTVKDLEHMLPRFDTSSESEDENHAVDEHAIPVEEEPFNPIIISPEKSPIDLSSLDADAESDDVNDSRPYDVSDILDDLSSVEEDWPAPPETTAEHDWPAPPDNIHQPGVQVSVTTHEADDDMPPPPLPPQSPDNRIASFMSPEPPKSPTAKFTFESEQPPVIVITASSDDLNAEFESLSSTSESDDDLFDDAQNEPEIERLSDSDDDKNEYFVDPQESSVDPKRFSGQDSDSSSDGGTSVDAVPSKKGAIVSVICKPTETTPDLRSLEKFRPDGTDEIPLYTSPPSDGLSSSSKEPAKVSDLEDLIPTFDSDASESDDDHEQSPGYSLIVEASITISKAPQPDESSVDLAELDRNIRDIEAPSTESDVNDVPKMRTESDLSTESQKLVMDIQDTGDSDVDDFVVPVSYAPVESTPDLTELERRLRPPGTKSPVSALANYQSDNRPVERTGATVEDLKDLVPVFDSASESSRSSQSESSEPTTPVDEMIEEIGAVSPTRTYFDFDGLERHAPKDQTELEAAPLDDFADRTSQEVMIESYLSIFREERMMELLKTTDVEQEASEERRESADKPSLEVGIKERVSVSSSAEGVSSSESEGEYYINDDKLPVNETRVPDSPSKKRRSIGLDQDGVVESHVPDSHKRRSIGLEQSGVVVDDDESPAKKTKNVDGEIQEESSQPIITVVDDYESPAKKPKTFDDETQDKSPEPIIIEASISVFREEMIIESCPNEEPKPDLLKAGDEGQDEIPAPSSPAWPAPPSPVWPDPPPPEVMAEDNWPAPLKDITASELRPETDKEDLDSEDTSSVSSSSTEGEYITEPSPSGADRVFVLTVIPTMSTFREEDEEDESGEDPGRFDKEERPNGVSVSTNYAPSGLESKSPRSGSESEPPVVGEKKPREHSLSEGTEPSPRSDSFTSGDDEVRKINENVLPHSDVVEPQILISTIEPVESAPFETAKVQPGFVPVINNSDNKLRKENSTEPDLIEAESPEKIGEYRKSSLSDTSSVEDAHIRPHQRKPHDVDENSDSVNERVSPQAFKSAPYDEQMEQEKDDVNEHDEGYRRNVEHPPQTRDSEGESDTTESSVSESGNESPFSPVGARIFILTGLPSYTAPNDSPQDVDNNVPEKNIQDTESWMDNDDNSNANLPEKTMEVSIPDLIPIETPTAAEETPDFIEEKPVVVEPIENLESAPTVISPGSEYAPMATTPSSDSEEDTSIPHANVAITADCYAPDVSRSPEEDISPQIASDTFSSPTFEDEVPQEQHEYLSDYTPGAGGSDEPFAPEQPRETFDEEDPMAGSDYENNDFDTEEVQHTYEPEHPTFAETLENEPQTHSEIPPSYSPNPNDWSAPTGHQSPPRSLSPDDRSQSSSQQFEQSGRGPSFSHYIPTRKTNEPQMHSEIPRTFSPQNTSDLSSPPSSHPAIPNLAPKFASADNYSSTPDDNHYGSDAEVAEFTSHPPKETGFGDISSPKETYFSDPAVPNLAPYMPTSRSQNVADNDPYSYSMPDPHTYTSSDIIDPASFDDLHPYDMPPSNETYMPNSRSPNVAESIPYSYSNPDLHTDNSSDIVEPASFDDLHHYDMPPSKETDINDPGIDINYPNITPFNQGSKSTDLTDPAVPEYVSKSPRTRSPFEPLQMHASPAKYGKPRGKTPIELETSLVPPDVYTSDDAYDQFQKQYRGHIDDDDFVVPEMRQKHPEPAKSKRKRTEEKHRRKDHAAVSDIPSYMAPPPPVQSEVSKAKGRRVPPPTPPRIESDPLLREPTHLGPQSRIDHSNRHRQQQPDRRHERPRSTEYHEYDEPPMPFQTTRTSKSTDITDPRISYNTRPKSMNISDLPMSYPSRSKSTDINDPGNSYPTRSKSTNYLPSELAPSGPAVAYPQRSTSTDINDPGLYYPDRSPQPELPIPRPSKAAPQYLMPNRGPIPDITKPQPAMHKDVELESLKRQLHKLGSKMALTRQELEQMKRANPANKYARPVDRAAHSRGSSRSSIDSPDGDMTDLKFSRKFFASLTDKEFGKMLEEMRLYRMSVRDKGGDLKRLSKQCDGIRLRLRQLGEPLESLPVPASGSIRVGAIETTI